MKDKLVPIIEGAFYAAIALFLADVSTGIEGLGMPAEVSSIIIGVLALVRSFFQKEAAKHGD